MHERARGGTCKAVSSSSRPTHKHAYHGLSTPREPRLRCCHHVIIIIIIIIVIIINIAAAITLQADLLSCSFKNVYI